ncbi:hypothetical protein DXA17_19635, partial [Ruminococcus sp. AM58-7XD]
LFSHLLLNDKALTNLESGMGLPNHLLLNDKALTNLESGMGLPNQIVTRQAWIANRKSVEKKLLTFKLPAIVKPNTLAASLGIDESSIIWKICRKKIINL